MYRDESEVHKDQVPDPTRSLPYYLNATTGASLRLLVDSEGCRTPGMVNLNLVVAESKVQWKLANEGGGDRKGSGGANASVRLGISES